MERGDDWSFLGLPVVLATLLVVLGASETLRTIAAIALKLPRSRRWGMLRVLKMPGSTRKRLAVLLAGPIGAYLVLVIIGLVMWGVQGVATERTFVAGTVEGSAAAGKLLANDRIVRVDGENTPNLTAYELGKLVNAKAGAPLTLTVDRGGQQLEIVVQPRPANDRYEKGWRLGVLTDHERDHGIGAILPSALVHPIEQVRSVGRFVEQLVTDDMYADPGNPLLILEEARRRPSAFTLLYSSTLYATFMLLCMLVFDLVRAIIVIVQGRRPPPIPRAAVQ